MNIKPEDISFIIQGPILGKSSDRDENRFTNKLVESILLNFPGSEIIISTWEGEDTAELNCSKVIFNEDPQSTIYNRATNYRYNVNRQIVSTLNGLKIASRKYSCKLRSDLFFMNSSFLKYYSLYKNKDKKYEIFSDKILLANVTSVNPRKKYKLPYHPCDWFYFGLTKDLLLIWDIPLCDEKVEAIWYDTREKSKNHPFKDSLARYQAEQYIWKSFLEKEIDLSFDNSCDLTDNNLDKSEIIFAKNVCILDLNRLGIRSQKHKIRLIHYYNMYSFGQWKRLYLKSQNSLMRYFYFDINDLINFISYYFYHILYCLYGKLRRNK